MSEETFIHLCNKLRPAMERQDTNFRVPLKKRITIALWKLATGAEYRSVTYVGRNSTVSTGHQGPAKESVSL